MSFKADKDRIMNALKTFATAYKGYKRSILGLGILGIFSGLLEGIGVNALIPLLSFMAGNYEGTGENVILKFLRTIFSAIKFDFALKYLLIFICLLFIVKACLLVLSQYVSIKITSDYEEKTRIDLTRRTFGASWPYLLKQRVGYLDTILMMDIRKSSILLEQIVAVIINIATLAVYLFVAFSISWFITVIALAVGLVLTLFLKPVIYKVQVLSRRMTAMNKEVAHYVNESIIGAKTIKSIMVEEMVAKVGYVFYGALRALQIRTALLKGVVSAFSQPISIIFISVTFAIFYKMPGFNFAVLAAIAYLIQRIFLYVQSLQNALQGILENYPYLAAILEYKKEAGKNKEKALGDKKFSFSKELRFSDVSFSYDTGAAILNGLNFKIKKGEMLGLVGQSGSGKTTVVDLLLRLLAPADGGIYLDENNIAEISIKDWRRHVGYVSQDIFLKNDTFENNIKFYDDSITEEEIISAAKMANIYDLIEGSPQGFKTMVGERGVLISGGQRQRIVLARVLARNPKILILDEATSSLDMESEALIQKAINDLKGKITVLIIAHRLQTITGCDRLLVLDGGKIVEEGPPEKLFGNKESYLYKMSNLSNLGG